MCQGLIAVAVTKPGCREVHFFTGVGSHSRLIHARKRHLRRLVNDCRVQIYSAETRFLSSTGRFKWGRNCWNIVAGTMPCDPKLYQRFVSFYHRTLKDGKSFCGYFEKHPFLFDRSLLQLLNTKGKAAFKFRMNPILQAIYKLRAYHTKEENSLQKLQLYMENSIWRALFSDGQYRRKEIPWDLAWVKSSHGPGS